MLQRTLPSGFIAPCLPSKTDKLPSGSQWLHEIKHDGFRVIARKTGAQVRLYSRPGNDLTYRFPLIVETLARLRSRSCIIDGEAVACDDNGVTSFNHVRYRHHDESIFLYAFDLIELNGDDLRRDHLQGRKAKLGMILAKAGAGIRFNEHMEGDGETVFRHACRLGLEGIVSKRKDSAYRSGRSADSAACGPKKKPRQKLGGTTAYPCSGGRLTFSLRSAIRSFSALHKAKVPCVPRAIMAPPKWGPRAPNSNVISCNMPMESTASTIVCKDIDGPGQRTSQTPC
jgi:bifunctional non-homologous end joining protein LigD